MSFERWERINRALLLAHFRTYDKEATETDSTYLAWAELRYMDANL